MQDLRFVMDFSKQSAVCSALPVCMNVRSTWCGFIFLMRARCFFMTAKLNRLPRLFLGIIGFSLLLLRVAAHAGGVLDGIDTTALAHRRQRRKFGTSAHGIGFDKVPTILSTISLGVISRPIRNDWPINRVRKIAHLCTGVNGMG